MSVEGRDALLAAEGLGPDYGRTLDLVAQPLADRAAAAHERMGRTAIIGICGAQGSGKSTLAAVVRRLLVEAGLSAAVLSLDDLYLPRDARAELARKVHPLFATRGPPGTHDVALGLSVLEGLGRPGAVALPRFDKALDTRPTSGFERIEAPVDVVLFEGWCVGARPQAAAALAKPVNALEADEDPKRVWRRHVNRALAGPYAELFAKLDELVLLQAPSFEVVAAWRGEQERKLSDQLAAEGRPGATMDAAELAHFISHYERLTRHILAEMPARADWVVPLDANRRPFPENT